jgi:hypothetical protein
MATVGRARDKMSQQRDEHHVRPRGRLRDCVQLAELAVGEPAPDLDHLALHFRHDGTGAADGEQRQHDKLQEQRDQRSGFGSH